MTMVIAEDFSIVVLIDISLACCCLNKVYLTCVRSVCTHINIIGGQSFSVYMFAVVSCCHNYLQSFKLIGKKHTKLFLFYANCAAGRQCSRERVRNCSEQNGIWPNKTAKNCRLTRCTRHAGGCKTLNFEVSSLPFLIFFFAATLEIESEKYRIFTWNCCRVVLFHPPDEPSLASHWWVGWIQGA